MCCSFTLVDVDGDSLQLNLCGEGVIILPLQGCYITKSASKEI